MLWRAPAEEVEEDFNDDVAFTNPMVNVLERKEHGLQARRGKLSNHEASNLTPASPPRSSIVSVLNCLSGLRGERDQMTWKRASCDESDAGDLDILVQAQGAHHKYGADHSGLHRHATRRIYLGRRAQVNHLHILSQRALIFGGV